MKRFLWIILAFCLCLIWAGAAADPTAEGDLAYGILRITGTGDILNAAAFGNDVLPWAGREDEIERVIIEGSFNAIGEDVLSGLGTEEKPVRIDFLQENMPDLGATDQNPLYAALSDSYAICRHYTENSTWPEDGVDEDYDNLSWIYLPVYAPYTEENGFVVTYFVPKAEGEVPTGDAPYWTVRDDDWVSHKVTAEQAAEISYRGRDVYLEAMPSDDDFALLCGDWFVMERLQFDYGCTCEGKTIDIPVKDNPWPHIRCVSDDVTLTVNVAAGGKVRLEVVDGNITCNGDVELLEMCGGTVRVNGNAGEGISGDVDQLNVTRNPDGSYSGFLTVDGTVGGGFIYGEADVPVSRTTDRTVYFSQIAIATFPAFHPETAIISEGGLNIPGVDTTGGWPDIYALEYGADYSTDSINGEWTVCLMPKDALLSSSFIETLDDFSMGQVIYGNTNLTISNYNGETPLQIGDEDDLSLGIGSLGVNEANVEVNCPVHSLACEYKANAWYQATINSSLDQLWINGESMTTSVTLGQGALVKDGYVSRAFRDQLLFGPVNGPSEGTFDLYSECQLHVPGHKSGQAISYILPSDYTVTQAAGRGAIMDLYDGFVTDEEEGLLNIAPGEKVSAVVDVDVLECITNSDGSMSVGGEIHEQLEDDLQFALTAPAGTRVVRLHDDGINPVTAADMPVKPAADGTILVSSDLFSKYVLLDSNTWGYEYVSGENMLKITGTGAVNVNGLAPWIYSGYDIDRVMVDEGITAIGANVFDGLKDRVRIDFCEEEMPEIDENAFGDTDAVCRYTSEDDSWDPHPVIANVTWAWMPTFNTQGAGTFGPLWYAKDEETPGWSVEVMAEERTCSNMSAETAHEILRYSCDSMILNAIPEDLGTVIGDAETDSWYIVLSGGCSGTLKLNGANGIECAVLPTTLIMAAPDLALNVTDTRDIAIRRLEVQNGTVNYTGDMQKLVLKNSGETGSAAVTVNGTIGELAFYGEGSDSPFHGTLTVSGGVHAGVVYTGGEGTMEIPGVTDSYPVSGSPALKFAAELNDLDDYLLIDTSAAGTETDPVVKTALADADAPTMAMFKLRYILRSTGNWLTMTPKGDAGLGSEPIDVDIDEYNAQFLNDLTNNIVWGDDTDIFVSMQNGDPEIILTGKAEKGINEFSASGWSTVTVKCAVNNLQLQPDPMTIGALDLTFEGRVRNAYLQPNNCSLNITLQNGGSINGGRWKQLLREYRNFGYHSTSANGSLELVKDGALTVMSQDDFEMLSAILPSDADVSAAVGEGKTAMAVLTEGNATSLDGRERSALSNVTDGNEKIAVGENQIISMFDVSVYEYTVDQESGNATKGDSVTTQLGQKIPVTVSNDSDATNVFVVRLHNEDGKVSAEKLDVTDYNGGKQFRSDLFSTYLLVNGDAEPVVPDEGLSLRIAGDQSTGQYYYKVYFDSIPDWAEGAEIGYGDPESEEPDADSLSYRPIDEFYYDDRGLFVITLPPEDAEGDTAAEAMFARISDEDEWAKVTYICDLTKAEAYYFSCNAEEAESGSGFTALTLEDLQYIFLVPGAEEVQLMRRKTDWEDGRMDGFAYSNQFEVSTWDRINESGTYEIYGAHRKPGKEEWEEPVLLCAIQINSPNGSLGEPQVDIPMTVSAGECVTISIRADEAIEEYSYWISYENGDWLGSAGISREELEPGTETVTFTIPAEYSEFELEENTVYHIGVDIGAKGYEEGHTDRQLYVLGEPDEDVEVTVETETNGKIRIGEDYPVTVFAPGANELLVWWECSLNFIHVDGDYFSSNFCMDWKPGEGHDSCDFYALALYDDHVVKVSETKTVAYETKEVPYAEMPSSLTLGNGEGLVYRGQFVQAVVGAITGEDQAYEYHAYLTDGEGRWVSYSGSPDPGTILLPTSELEPGTYYMSAYGRVHGKYRNDYTPAVEVEIAEAEENGFYCSSNTVLVNEPMMVSIVAPGAERIRFYDGYCWWGEEGGEGDTWFNNEARWSEPAEGITLRAEAWFEGNIEWTEIGTKTINVTSTGNLDEPEIRTDSMVNSTQALTIKVPLVENGTEYELSIHDTGMEGPVVGPVWMRANQAEKEDGEDILTFTVEPDTLEDGHTYRIFCDAYTDVPGLCGSRNSKMILVNNNEANQDIEVEILIDGEAASGHPITIPINKKFDIHIKAPGAEAIMVYYGNRRDHYIGEEITENFAVDESGEAIVYARAYFGDEQDWQNMTQEAWDGLAWCEPSETIDIRFTCEGTAGGAKFNAPESIARGEILTLFNITLGDHADEAHANISRSHSDEEGWILDDWVGWDENTRTISLPTYMLEPRNELYWLAVDGNGVGWDYGRTWYHFEVTGPDNEIVFDAPESVFLGESIPVSIYAPDATMVGFSVDAHPEQTAPETVTEGNAWFEAQNIRIEEGAPEPGMEHTLCAWALMDGQWEKVTRTIRVISLGELAFDLTGLPDLLTAGEDAGITIPMPEHGEGLNYSVFAEWQEDGEYRQEKICDGSDSQTVRIEINARYLKEGGRISVDVNAWAIGYAGTGDHILIPVAAPVGEGASLTLSEGNISNVLANEEIEYCVAPAEGETIKAVRFYDVYGYWEDGNPITPAAHPAWFREGKAYFTNRYNEPDDRTLIVFAEVQLEGSDEWFATNVLKFTVKSSGSAGEFDLENPSPDPYGNTCSARRGEVITIRYTLSEGADNYWVNVTGPDNCGYEARTDFNVGESVVSVRISTVNLPAGVYTIMGCAGRNAPGLLWRESPGLVTLTVTEDVPALNPTFVTPAGLVTIEDGAFEGIAARCVKVSERVTSIGSRAFAGSGDNCGPIEIFIPESVEAISDDAFADREAVTIYGIAEGCVKRWAEDHMYIFFAVPED